MRTTIGPSKICQLQTLRLAHSPSRSWLLILVTVALAFATLSGAINAAIADKPTPLTPQRERLALSPEGVMEPWTGDLDGII